MVQINISQNRFVKMFSGVFAVIGELPEVSQELIDKKLQTIRQKFDTKDFEELVYQLREGSHEISSGWFHAILVLYHNDQIKFIEPERKIFSINYAKSYIWCSIIGVLVIVNQLGYLLNKSFNISFLSPIWTFTLLPNILSLATLFKAFLSLMLLQVLLFGLRKGYALSFVKGFSSGVFAIPIAGIAASLIFIVFKIVPWLFHIISVILSYVFGAIGWVLKTIIAPIVKFITIPIVWLYDKLISPIVSFISTPFVWLFQHILAPVFHFVGTVFGWIFNVILYKVLLVILSTLGFMIASFPPYLVGSVIVQNYKDITKSKINLCNVFGYGVGMGIVFCDLVLNIVGYKYNVTSGSPSIMFEVYLVLALLFMLRYLKENEVVSTYNFSYKYMGRIYLEKNNFEVISAIFMVPLAFIANVVSHSEEN